MSFDIIDFHTHPFLHEENNICNHQSVCALTSDSILEEMRALGISRVCGSVIPKMRQEDKTPWDAILRANNDALALRERFGGFYIPGFHVHPAFIEESIEEIHRMHACGVRLIGELVPYICKWESFGLDLASDAFSVILDEAEKYGMTVSFHSDENADAMDEMVRRHKNLTIVAAHPGEHPRLMRHIARAKMSENYYLDLSGTGIFRYMAVGYTAKQVGAERILFGSDYPTCNPGGYIGALLCERLSERENRLILGENAKRLLGIK
jgi:predicted TIM-barrel fold metal-dependent hydrolase